MKIFIIIMLITINFIPNYEIKMKVFQILTYIWFICTFIYFLKLYIENRKKNNYMYKKEIPNKRDSESLSFIIKGQITKEQLLSTVRELIKKEIIVVGKYKETEEYVLISKKESLPFLSLTESFIIKWFFDDIGDGEHLTFTSLKNEISKNIKFFSNKYKEYVELLSIELTQQLYFENKNIKLENIFFYIFISFIFSILKLIFVFQFITGMIVLIITIGFLIIVANIKNRTDKINREYSEWISFKKWIQENPRSLDEITKEDIELCIVYAKILDIDNIVFDYLVNNKEYDTNFVISYKEGIIHSFEKIIEKGIRKHNRNLIKKEIGYSSERRPTNKEIIEIIGKEV